MMLDKARSAALARRNARLAADLAKAIGRPTVFAPAPKDAPKIYFMGVRIDPASDALFGWFND